MQQDSQPWPDNLDNSSPSIDNVDSPTLNVNDKAPKVERKIRKIRPYSTKESKEVHTHSKELNLKHSLTDLESHWAEEDRNGKTEAE